MSGDAGALPECEVYTLMAPDQSTFQVHGSWLGGTSIGRSSGECLNTGLHEKALVRCPCSQLAALHGAPRTLLLHRQFR